MVRHHSVMVIVLVSWFLSANSSAAIGLRQTETSKQSRRLSPLVTLLGEGGYISASWLHILRLGYSLPPPLAGKLPTVDNIGTGRLNWDRTFNDIGTVKALLDKGVDVDARDERGATALLYALAHASLPVIKELLRRGADVNAADRFGDTPLLIAVGRQLQPIVKELLRRGADVNAADQFGNTSLMLAATQRNVRLVSLLVKHGANVNTRNTLGRIAVGLVDGDPKVVRILVHAGARIDASALTAAAAIMDIKPASIGALLDGGIDINARDENGRTALFNAATSENVELVRYLLKRGADAHIVDEFGRTVIEYASYRGMRQLNPKVMELLRKAGETE